MTNVHKHNPGAATIVTLERDEDALRVEVVNAPGRPAAPQPGNGYGLIGMRERVEMIGGLCTITSAPGEGTLVHAQIPFKHGHKEHTRP